ncbi:hypothetical protein [Chryseobacterium indoltheticum]|uniref:Uncharacterized protein n=1 Tax=Chryseobacterium indoltheticum TaxID=254 RepID=A0A3G6N503_9FLAO|nr:hypothetical protein [Chryseobacterium indoltheticum]AZA60099.1 hypothetical protein EG340_03165 [Chryseobacterium indoltheticum]
MFPILMSYFLCIRKFDTLKSQNTKDIWNIDILKTKNYHDFTLFHLKELVRLRFVPSDCPKSFIEKASKLSGEDLLNLSIDSANSNKINAAKFKTWNLEDALLNLYQLQSADELAKKDIPESRLLQFKILHENFEKLNTEDEFLNQLKTFFRVLYKLSSGDPTDHFEIDFKKGMILKLK